MVEGEKMVKYIEKNVVQIEVVKFHEFIAEGLKCATNIVNGLPWSFVYKQKYMVTHENDKCYIIVTDHGTEYFTPHDVIVTTQEGETFVLSESLLNHLCEEMI